TQEKSWLENMKVFLDKRSITMLFLGFSAGLPILMIFSSLSLWLREAGVQRSAVTYFSWAALGYSFKFIWAPLVDRLPLPILTNMFGRRRSWLLVSQGMIISAICGMALVDPASSANSMTWMAIAAVMLGFSSATQDIVIDAYRIESAEDELQAILSATYIAGYRIGMLTSGAGALFLADFFGTSKAAYNYDAWKWTYIIMAGFMLIGVATTLLRPEPEVKEKEHQHSTVDYARFFFLFILIAASFVTVFFLSADVSANMKKSLIEVFNNKALASLIVGTLRLGVAIGCAGLFAFGIGKSGLVNTDMVEEGYIAPVKNFFDRYGTNFAILLLALIGLYRISDIVLGVISNVFYQDLGFTKIQIASVVKTFGLVMSLLGGFLGGLLTTRFGVYKMLLWGAILAAGTNLLFMILAQVGNNMPMLYLVISADNLAAGLASAAFVAFLSSLTDVSFTAVQYAIFSSLMTLIPKVLGGYSGGMVDTLGYSGFFILTTLMGVPVLYIVWLCGKKFKLKENSL
ncbi:MAG: MFS transporter, partial [Bacteriovoracaceae bacterium]|nr:MFS transporter [Bacteriovoracaceae bacterium]